MLIPRICELLQGFKGKCRSRGWKTSTHEDWVKANEEYHNFLWARTIHPSTFKKIMRTRRCAVRKGISYQVVDVAYTAWLFSESPSEELWRLVLEDTELSRKTAIYDLSWVHAGKAMCSKFNETDSKVFQEFENFLGKEWRVEFKRPRRLLTRAV